MNGLLEKQRDELKLSAKESTDFRGHDLSEWTNYDDSSAEAICKNCGKKVFIDAVPALNSIEIHGSAVAVHCKT